jgi:hypothetical protein
MSLFYFWFSYIASFLGVHSSFAVNLPPEKNGLKGWPHSFKQFTFWRHHEKGNWHGNTPTKQKH